MIRVLHRASFRDDPTRVFRAVRYAARLGFELDPETDELARAALREGLVGHLSGSRVRAELLALLGRGHRAGRCRPPRSARRLPRGLAGPRLRSRVPRRSSSASSSLRQRYSARTPAWRCALVVLARGLPDADLPVLAQRLVLRKRDAATLRGAVGVPRAGGRRRSRRRRRGVRGAAGGGGARSPQAREAPPATTYLDHLRGVQLSIDGGVLRDELGLEESPRVGEVLRELLRRKRNGELETRAAELAAARELVGGPACDRARLGRRGRAAPALDVGARRGRGGVHVAERRGVRGAVPLAQPGRAHRRRGRATSPRTGAGWFEPPAATASPRRWPGRCTGPRCARWATSPRPEGSWSPASRRSRNPTASSRACPRGRSCS